ncbi:coiled-coil domain-containing protein 108-like [Notothenia coriiceps]|uniref:Coiled-coil domain-containing protein 108-like n=1 Tax=Notothenia coriiceps TaxID=8208 RepID=A0A6I9NUF8_9TELE|nr:PREDICTED: coiled-coil domain-containing protein 108-like [Notothenia coriiceps]
MDEEVVFLSDDSVSLGDIPVCSQSSRILFLTNVSHTDTVHYTWELQSNKQAVQIHPERGTLCPGESAPCVLTFTSTDYPAVYQLDIICQVFQEAVLTRYYDALQHLEEEKKRQRDEFTITDKIIKGSYGVLIDKEPVAAPVRKGPPLRKYKTLPPICASAACETVGGICTKITRAEKRAQREKGNVWRCPEPPLPALLHLGVTARSHGLLEYRAHFPDQSSDFRCLQSVNPRQPESTSLHAGRGSQRKGPDRDVTMRILVSLLRGILDDPAFSQSLISMESKPITYQPRKPGPSLSPSSLPSSSSSYPAPQAQLLSSGAQGEEDQLCPVDGEGTPHPEHVPADVSEEVLLNTLQNLIIEAVGGELDLTAHPRTVMLPPVSTRTRRMPNAVAEEEKEDFINWNT